MITDVEDFFTKGCGRCARFATPECSTRPWATGLRRLRQICLSVGLVEAVKWAHPCYMHADRKIAIIGALRADFRISFFHAALLKDPDHGQVAVLEPVIRTYLMEAMGYAEAGIKPAKSPLEMEMPSELAEALSIDPELAAAFHRLTPGRQKSYVINLNAAKKAETRIARIARFRDKILAGQGALE